MAESDGVNVKLYGNRRRPAQEVLGAVKSFEATNRERHIGFRVHGEPSTAMCEKDRIGETIYSSNIEEQGSHHVLDEIWRLSKACH